MTAAEMSATETDLDKKAFSNLIEELVTAKPQPYMDAILTCATIHGLEPEFAARLINKNIKGKLEAEAQNLNLLTGGGSRLPL